MGILRGIMTIIQRKFLLMKIMKIMLI